MCKIDGGWKLLIAQGSAWCSRRLGGGGRESGKEAPEGWDGMHAAALLCCAAETNTVR